MDTWWNNYVCHFGDVDEQSSSSFLFGGFSINDFGSFPPHIFRWLIASVDRTADALVGLPVHVR